MMLQHGVSPDSGDAAASAHPHDISAAAAAGVAADFSEDERGRTEDGGRNSGGNRWPRQETLYLLKIRQDMDVAFRDSTLKGPLWDEVSRKLASLGFHRSAKKCKEKFENVYKYHKRIKEGRTSKSDGKTYKFFDQLEALEATPAAGNHHQPPLSLPPMMNPTQVPSIPSVVTPVATPISVAHQNNNNNVDPISVAAPAVALPLPPAVNVNHVARFPFSQLNTDSSSSSTSSEDEPPEKRRNRKRKWEEFFGRLMKEVVSKQEELQSKFLDSLERRERDRTAREEAWRMQEIAKMKREHELLVQERSMVAAKDAAVITFLQKITDQNSQNPNAVVIPQLPAATQLFQPQQQQQNQIIPIAPTPVAPPPPPAPPEQPPPQHTPPPVRVPIAAPVSVSVQPPALPPLIKHHDNGGHGVGENMLQPSPSRWPKAEINALIQIRTSLDTKYQEGGPKGPLWEEVSAAMRNLGYNRNAKRCKEKWENINKYYKKVKESSKKRPDDSKTCPYFHQLDAIYREKAASGGNSSSNNNSNPSVTVKPESQNANMAPIMARPEQQWPLPTALPTAVQDHQNHHHQYQSKVDEPRGTEDHRNTDLNDDDYDDEDDDDEDEDEEGGDYEIVPNKTSSMAAVE